MYLKSLDIRGFKSFAEATHIEFSTGLNLVVGPNGCGKSNLVDAIRWVMGEQNVRNLRGQKLEDVIFAGTDQKRALSMASVSLTIDNTDQILPSPYTEIMINRRVYRSEQSEFYLNQQQVRLKDINNLFSGTGVGRKGYAIIGQGEIENLLSARPHDIRLMLEEASGLIRYRYQKEEALERMRNIDRDLQRLADIAGELEGRLGELKIKAEKAAQYLALSAERHTVHTLLLKSEWSMLKREIDNGMAALDNYQSEAECCAREVARLEADHNDLFANHQHLQQELDDVKNQRYQTINLKQQLEVQHKNIVERITEAKTRQEEIVTDKKRMSEQLETLKLDLEKGNQTYNEQLKVVNSEKSSLDKLRGHWQQIVEEHQGTLRRLELLKSSVMHKARENAEIRNHVQHLSGELSQFAGKKQQYSLELEQRTQFVNQAREQQSTLAQQALLCQQEIDLLNSELGNTYQELDSIVEQREKAQEKLADWRRQFVQAQHEIQSLQNIEENYSGYSDAVKGLLRKHKQQSDYMPGLLGVVGELIQVPAGLETAIEVALGRGMENLIVTGESDARQGIEMLKKNKWGRATFLPLDLLKADSIKPAVAQSLNKETGVLGIASDLVSYPEEARTAFIYLLGRIVIVDNLDTGMRLLRSGKYNLRLVTRDGEVLLPQGAITGGRRQNDASVLKRKARYNQLIEEQKHIQQQETEGQAVLLNKTAAEKTVREQIENLQRRQQELEYRITLLAEEKNQIEAGLKQQSERVEEINWQCRLLEQDRSKRQQELENWEKQLNQLAGEAEEHQQELETCKQATDELIRQVEVGREKISAQEAIVSAREREMASLGNSQQQLSVLYQNMFTSCQQLDEKMTALQQQCRHQEQQLVILASDTKTQEARQEKLSEQEQALQLRLQDFNAQAAALMNHLTGARFELDKLQEKKRQCELRLARQETEFLLFDQQISDEDKATGPIVLSDKKLRELRSKETGLNQQIEQIGPVDPGSVDEFKATGERFALLSTQHQDLTRARQSLIKLIKDSEQVMQGQFSEFLREADASFNRTFTDIFGGGEAALRMLEDEDIGVELVVKMPGKKRQSLNMLSGGERALTCIALIFSLLRLKPVPFCVLDEIDAALDEVNLQRFTSFMRQMAADIQFIIISHRQGTIEIANTLYGVTMPQGGISTVLSVQMNEQLVG